MHAAPCGGWAVMAQIESRWAHCVRCPRYRQANNAQRMPLLSPPVALHWGRTLLLGSDTRRLADRAASAHRGTHVCGRQEAAAKLRKRRMQRGRHSHRAGERRRVRHCCFRIDRGQEEGGHNVRRSLAPNESGDALWATESRHDQVSEYATRHLCGRAHASNPPSDPPTPRCFIEVYAADERCTGIYIGLVGASCQPDL